MIFVKEFCAQSLNEPQLDAQINHYLWENKDCHLLDVKFQCIFVNHVERHALCILYRDESKELNAYSKR